MTEGGILGHVPPRGDDHTGPCPCGCGALYFAGEPVTRIAAERGEQRAALARIRAAAKSDADLAALPALRDFLLRETEAGAA